MTPIPNSGPAPIESDPTPDAGPGLPGLDPVTTVPLPPVAGSASNPPVLPDDLPDQAEAAEPPDEPPSAAVPDPVLTEAAPEAPSPPAKPLTESPEYQRLVRHIVALERRQRAVEKNVLILAAALAFVVYQLGRKPKSPVVGVEPIAAVPDLPDLTG